MKKHATKSRDISREQEEKSLASNPKRIMNPLCDDRLTALPPSIDIAALATLYNSQPKSHIAHEYLLEQARRSLLKYELAQADLELAADSLARAMHLLIEQHGLDSLPPEELSRLERDILEWYDLVPQQNEPSIPSAKPIAPKSKVKSNSQRMHSKQPSTRNYGTNFAH